MAVSAVLSALAVQPIKQVCRRQRLDRPLGTPAPSDYGIHQKWQIQHALQEDTRRNGHGGPGARGTHRRRRCRGRERQRPNNHRYADASDYLIEVPLDWNGTLLLYSHSYTFGPDNPAMDVSTEEVGEALLRGRVRLSGFFIPWPRMADPGCAGLLTNASAARSSS